MQFSGRVILVTGGARGQGAAEVRALVDAGAKVVFGDVLESEGRELEKALSGNAVFVRQDVSKESDWEAALSVAESLGGLHGLVNNAAIFRWNSFQETNREDLESHFQVNQLGTYLGMKFVAPLMQRSGGGSIVNISSVAGLRAARDTPAYSATKWAIRGMTKAAALELAKFQIRVNSVHPGLIETPILAAQTAEHWNAVERRVPLGRRGRSEEVAKLVLFLLSDDASYITGSEISIDGGLLLV